MYNSEGKVCPLHPTIIRPCAICGSPSEQVLAHSPAFYPVAGINYEFESTTDYNTPAPFHPKHDNMAHGAGRWDLDEHWDERRRRRGAPVPIIGTMEELLDSSSMDVLSPTDPVTFSTP